MKKENKQPHVFNSVSELNQALGLPGPLHPLVGINYYKDMKPDWNRLGGGMVMNLYKISYKTNYTGKFKYGQNYYDFNEGGLCFTSPNQVMVVDEEDQDYGGFSLLIHPDFLRNYQLAKTIKNYGFFSYSASEALHLSEKEKETIFGIIKMIQDELELPIDQFSQDVIVTQIELLLNYSNRFYNRQFITRKAANNDLLTELEDLMTAYFDTEKASMSGLPAVQDIANQLNVSPRYLSDMLRSHTGQSAQQHIHNKLIEKAKEILSTSNLTIAEIAYRLGFEHPQSFNKLFKRKTNQSPVAFRQSFLQN
ncbi:helix-turn-helix transcriptional regulator [Mucilaginibacter sp.]|jgi:AraC-like DNA-binding protein|uniref:helix-turn-helix domain-containing protein n=1 Tax=Mucilaginibacter sp. TaxID=1882438 RepID=UPI002C373C58|nr:helix-turn-helix transcriptional regulator [Mucilaginibacter sp.]HTI58073.1 helix-turn-helix transcriptional regulator [Mucilaginibacter sp.]